MCVWWRNLNLGHVLLGWRVDRRYRLTEQSRHVLRVVPVFMPPLLENKVPGGCGRCRLWVGLREEVRTKTHAMELKLSCIHRAKVYGVCPMVCIAPRCVTKKYLLEFCEEYYCMRIGNKPSVRSLYCGISHDTRLYGRIVLYGLVWVGDLLTFYQSIAQYGLIPQQMASTARPLLVGREFESHVHHENAF